MAGFARKTLITIALALFVAAVALPIAAGAAEEYPPTPSTAGESVTRASGEYDPGATAAGRLAFTGSSDTVPTVVIAGGLVIFGAGLLLVARQRRVHTERS